MDTALNIPTFEIYGLSFTTYSRIICIFISGQMVGKRAG